MEAFATRAYESAPSLSRCLPPALQSLLSPIDCFPPPPPAPHQSLSADQTASLPFYSPPTPSSHVPLSCAAAMHKYINLVSVYACVCGGGMSTYRRRDGNPTGRPPFMCHQITDAQCLHTRPIQTPPNSTPAASPRTCHPGWGSSGYKGWESTWRWWCQRGSLI